MNIKYELENYRKTTVKIKDLELTKIMLKAEDGVRGLELNEKLSPSYKTGDPTGEIVVSSTEKIDLIDKRIDYLKAKQMRVLNLIEALEPDAQKVVKAKYINMETANLTGIRLADELHMCYGTVRSILQKSLKILEEM